MPDKHDDRVKISVYLKPEVYRDLQSFVAERKIGKRAAKGKTLPSSMTDIMEEAFAFFHKAQQKGTR